MNFFQGDPNFPQSIQPDETTGAFAQQFWNNASGASGTLSPTGDGGQGEAVAYDGFSVAWDAAGSGSGPYYSFDPKFPPGGPADYRLMIAYLETAPDKPASVTLSNIPRRFFANGHTYAVVVYFDRDSVVDRVNKLSVSGAKTGSRAIFGLDKAEPQTHAQWVLVPSSSTTDQEESTPAGNYVVFSGLADSTITVTATGAFASDGNSRAAINAIQIVPDEPATLLNISTRGRVGPGDDAMIAGFIIGGTKDTGVIVRVLGPSLGNPSFTYPPLADALQDPRLEIHDKNGQVIAENDDFANASQEQQDYIRNNGLAPPDPKEPAVGLMLSPTSYTAVVRGAGESTGKALVEVYNVR